MTQIITANLAAKYHDPVAVLVGAVLALWAAAAAAILGGRGLVRVVPVRLIARLAVIVMAVFGVISIIRRDQRLRAHARATSLRTASSAEEGSESTGHHRRSSDSSPQTGRAPGGEIATNCTSRCHVQPAGPAVSGAKGATGTPSPAPVAPGAVGPGAVAPGVPGPSGLAPGGLAPGTANAFAPGTAIAGPGGLAPGAVRPGSAGPATAGALAGAQLAPPSGRHRAAAAGDTADTAGGGSAWRAARPHGTACRSRLTGPASRARSDIPDSSVASRSAAAASVASPGSKCPPSWSHRPILRWRVSRTRERAASRTAVLAVMCPGRQSRDRPSECARRWTR